MHISVSVGQLGSTMLVDTVVCGLYISHPLQWRHNGRDSVSNHQPRDCLLNRLFRRRSQKPSKLRVTGLCAGKSPGTGEFPEQMASDAENVSIWWRHHANMHVITLCYHLLWLLQQFLVYWIIQFHYFVLFGQIFRVATLAVGQSDDCPVGQSDDCPNVVFPKNMGKPTTPQ